MTKTEILDHLAKVQRQRSELMAAIILWQVTGETQEIAVAFEKVQRQMYEDSCRLMEAHNAG